GFLIWTCNEIVYRRHTYWSATGVQQGDSLRPILFALVLHSLVHKIRDNCKTSSSCLDDGTIFGDSEEVARVLDIIKVSGSGLGLELNIKKTGLGQAALKAASYKVTKHKKA
ncbi:putative reverse transcriptase domain-containing protein, partial [Tanacetum coccineum]